MNTYELLPEKISDETAYHMVNFLMNLALEVESHYFIQIRRYTDNDHLEYSSYLQDELDDELPI